MKPQIITLCLNPSGCGDPLKAPQKGKAGILLALPRFPDREVCQHVNKQCAPFIDTLRKQLADSEELKLLGR